MGGSRPGWEVYERMIARLIADQLSIGLCVTPNARVEGRISGRQRQVDVLIDARHDTDNSRRIIVDAKSKKRKIDVKDVEAFRGMMEDVDATHGFLVVPQATPRRPNAVPNPPSASAWYLSTISRISIRGHGRAVVDRDANMGASSGTVTRKFGWT